MSTGICLNTSVIKTPQIFVIYEPGMYGTFLCNLFIDHPLYNAPRNHKKVDTTMSVMWAHHFGYLDIIKEFHDHNDIIDLLKKDPVDQYKFFQALNNYGLGVSRLCSYYAVSINFQKYFDKFVRIIVKPKIKDRIGNYAKRMNVVVKPAPAGQYWAKLIKKKNWTDIPKWFIDGMTEKECYKYLSTQTNFLDSTHRLDPNRDIMFDPDNITNKTALEKMISTACDMLEIENFNPSFKNLKHFAQKNKKFLQN